MNLSSETLALALHVWFNEGLQIVPISPTFDQ